MKKMMLALTLLLSAICAWGQLPLPLCEGSRMPYPIPSYGREYPDSLKPVMINHVGRHGARYPTSPKQVEGLLEELNKAHSTRMLTSKGERLRALVANVVETVGNKWGDLDSLGMDEQRGIAARMVADFPEVFKDGRVNAYSSETPRCRMSMYSFVHQLSAELHNLDIDTESGPEFTPFMRPFSIDTAYIDYRREEPYKHVYDDFCDLNSPADALDGIFKKGFVQNAEHRRDLASKLYYTLSTLSAMSYNANVLDFMSLEDFNKLWECDNLRQYLTRSANIFSQAPADIASLLLVELITSTEMQVAKNGDEAPVQLRFGHAETLMPLYSLMKVPGGYYEGDDWNHLADVWQTWNIVPMAANIQIILFRSDSGRYYIRMDLNEKPTPIKEGTDQLYWPWREARDYWLSLLPS